MAAMTPIKVFECRSCGRWTTWLDWVMPAALHPGKKMSGWCDGCGTGCEWLVRSAGIAPADLRYAERFNRESKYGLVDVTGLAE